MTSLALIVPIIPLLLVRLLVAAIDFVIIINVVVATSTVTVDVDGRSIVQLVFNDYQRPS